MNYNTRIYGLNQLNCKILQTLGLVPLVYCLVLLKNCLKITTLLKYFTFESSSKRRIYQPKKKNL